MAGAGFSGASSGARSAPSSGPSRSPSSGAALQAASAQAALVERHTSSQAERGASGSGGVSRQADSGDSSQGGAGGASGAAVSAPAAVVARGDNPMAQTSNAAASQLPTRTAVLQRPSADTPQGASHGGGHGAPPSSPAKSDAPKLPGSSSANGSNRPSAALASPAKAVAALPPAPAPAQSTAPPALSQPQTVVSGNNGGVGGMRGWIDGLRGYRYRLLLPAPLLLCNLQLQSWNPPQTLNDLHWKDYHLLPPPRSLFAANLTTYLRSKSQKSSLQIESHGCVPARVELLARHRAALCAGNMASRQTWCPWTAHQRRSAMMASPTGRSRRRHPRSSAAGSMPAGPRLRWSWRWAWRQPSRTSSSRCRHSILAPLAGWPVRHAWQRARCASTTDADNNELHGCSGNIPHQHPAA